MTYYVVPADIECGVRASGTECPIVRAVRRAERPGTDLFVTREFMRVGSTSPQRLPWRARMFIRYYDQHPRPLLGGWLFVRPFSFEVSP